MASAATEEAQETPRGFKLRRQVEPQAGVIYQVEWSPDGGRLAFCASELPAAVIRPNGEYVHVELPEKITAYSVSWSPNSTQIAIGATDGNIYLRSNWDKSSTRPSSVLSGHKGPVNSVMFRPHGEMLASVGDDCTVRLWYLHERTGVGELRDHEQAPYSAVWSPGGERLATCSAPGHLVIRDSASLDRISERQRSSSHDDVYEVAWSPDGELLALALEEGFVQIISANSFEDVERLDGHRGAVTCVDFSYDNRLLASKSWDGTVRLWRCDTWEPVGVLVEPASNGSVTGLAFHPSQPVLATLGENDTVIRIWDLDESVLLPVSKRTRKKATKKKAAKKRAVTPPTRPTTERESVGGSVVTDQPSEHDALGFRPYVRALGEFLTHTDTEPPLTVSIEGAWGSGKSSFMRQLRSAFEVQGHVTVEFNPWRHDNEEQLWAAFALEFVRQAADEAHCTWNWPGRRLGLCLRRRLGGRIRRRLRRWLGRRLGRRLGLCLRRRLGRRLRRWLGRWLGRWRGHVRLAALRFSWKDGWVDVVCLASLALVAFGVALAIPYLVLQYGPGWIEPFLNELVTMDGWKSIFGWSYGPTAVAVFAAIITAWRKLKGFTHSPLDIDLKRHLKSPDYSGRTAFIDHFHRDFAKIVEAYAGKRNVYVFIDDLDRCTVPRAAELMQALSLMMDTNARVFFIIGMDREKVAAGLAVRHAKLLAYIGSALDDSVAKPEAERIGGLEYGYNFIEKFIQIPFTVPQPTPSNVSQFIDYVMLPRAIKTMSPLPKTASRSRRHSGGLTDQPPNQARETPPETPRTTVTPSGAKEKPEFASGTTPLTNYPEKLTVDIGKDSENVRKVVEMVAPALEFNPRRVKQFINVFRLRVLLAYRTGLFRGGDIASHGSGLSLPQLGKFVAISLRWPLFLRDLLRRPILLQELDRIAFEEAKRSDSPELARRWSNRTRLMELIRHVPSDAASDADAVKGYRVGELEVAKLLAISPVVARSAIESEHDDETGSAT